MFSKILLAATAIPLTLVQAASFSVGQEWQIVLNKPIDLSKPLVPDVDVYDIDMVGTSAATISALKASGKTVICYFSAGSYEDWRPDASSWTSADYGNPLSGWDGEWWANIKSSNVRNIMTKRIQLAASKGCDAIDPDNTDVANNDNGMGITNADVINYIKFLANTAAANGMKIGLKNSLDVLYYVSPYLSFAINESCDSYGECDRYNSFLQSGKPVFHIEYPSNAPKVKSTERANFCSDASVWPRMSTVMKTQDLSGWVSTCGGSSYTTATKASDS